MFRYFDKKYDHDQVISHVGHMSQVCGLKNYMFTEGRSAGVHAVDVQTGTGLAYTVLPSRCMDIAWASYKGSSLCHITPAGVVAPSFFESDRDEWMRSFTAGLLTTCGLNQVGGACDYNGEHYGLHGRISNIPAEKVSTKEYMEDDEYVLEVCGQMRQVKPLSENYILSRKIKSFGGRNIIEIHDVIENQMYTKQPFMILYHMNMGFPLLNEKSHLIIPNTGISSMIENTTWDIPNTFHFMPPQDQYDERVFYVDVKADQDGNGHALMLNDENNPEFGLHITFNANVLPRIGLWKQLTKQNYVVGIEPCNNYICGIEAEAEGETLQFLEPFETKTVTLRIEVLEADDIKRTLKSLEY